ncbi:MAG: hypothetical protein OXK16_14240 [bacterium]|nr:hypothetical protein [bacterium]
MTAIQFLADWQDGKGIKGAELSATFASLRIDVRDQLLTYVIDDRAQTIRNSIFVPLYPVAEWLVTNWWFIKYESENPKKKTDPAFNQRHSWGATDGYALPDLTITPSGSQTHLTWSRRSASRAKLAFLNEGRTIVDREQFMQDCADFIDKVTSRLLACGIESTLLQDEWAAIQTTDEDESEFCALSAGLGWDPYDLDDAMQSHVVTLADQLGPLSAEAVPAIDSSTPLKDCSAILETIRIARTDGLHLPSGLPFIPDERSNGGPPWRDGYELARRARSELGLDGQPIQNTELLAEVLGQSAATLKQKPRPVMPLERLALIDGVVTRDAEGGVSFGLKNRGQLGWRFLFCRALAEAISGHGDALVTRGNTERQQRNRAFAAEFLAPSASLGNKISDPVVDEEQVDDLAEEFGVSSWVISHQIENHRIARVIQRAVEGLEVRLGSTSTR